MKKINWLNVWINVRLLLIFVAVVGLYSFTSAKHEKRILTKTVVQFIGDDNQLLTSQTVNKLLIENFSGVKTINKVALDLNKLEKSVNKNKLVEKSDVFVSIDGVLKAVVKQRTPIVRVINKDSSFYIDVQGVKMPLSQVSSARVPLFVGEINTANNSKMLKLFRFINEDDFLKKNIIGMQLFPNGAIKMTNRNYDYDIDFGRAQNIERKFNNYKAFYQKAVQDSTILIYTTITLRFTQQVVCTK
jgi:cell division protein FtsQ